jgi:superkiller protein 3
MTGAMASFREGKVAEAVAAYQGVIARRPDTEDAYRKLAFVYWRTGRAADAIAVLESALRAGVTQTEVKIKLGEYLAQSGQAPKAIQLLSSFGGDDPDALIALGNAYQIAGRLPDAVKTFQHLVDIDPRNGVGFQNLGIARLQSRDFRGAEQLLRKALDVDPNLSVAFNALGVVFAQTNRKADAVEAWTRAVAIDNQDFDAMYNLIGALAEAGRLDEARSYGERFVNTAPPMLQNEIAAVRRLLGR